MRIDWWTLLLQTVNFAVLVWLLHRFLYQPILRLIDARKAEVQRQFDAAQAVAEQAKAQLAAAQADCASLAAQREDSVKAAAAQARETARALRAQAECDARAVLESAHESVLAERERVLEEARRVALDLGAEYARRLLAQVPVALRAEAWIEPMERRLKTLPTTQLESLVRELANGGVLTVTTASSLPAATRDDWSQRLTQILGRGHIVFEVKPELVAGAELHFPSAVLGFSWQSALAALRSQVTDNARSH
jgi:F-type H+-transporting ATPase subunit b